LRGGDPHVSRESQAQGVVGHTEGYTAAAVGSHAVGRPSHLGAVPAFFGALWLLIAPADAQLTDITQTPNTEDAGIHKSLEEQVGTGRGDVMTSDSSLFIIGRDPFRAIRRGRQVFQRKFTVAQGVGPRINDGRGDIETNTAIGNGR
jgi:hypothetical protein